MRSLLFCLILLSGCRSTSYFATPNDLRKQKVILYMKDGQRLPGELSISFENYYSANINYNPVVIFTPEGKNETETIKLNDIAGYSVGAYFYALKKVDLYMNNTFRLLFVKRLTGENSKIQLYELYESGRGNYSGESQYSYYLSLPSYDPLQTMNTRGIGLLPSFDQKMSEIVSDCPALAEKIRLKEKGYFIPQVTFAIKKHPEVLLKIINEYNNCK